MSVQDDAEFLKGPVYNQGNFSKMHNIKFAKNVEKTSKYIPVEENEASIPIKSEFRSILIDYLQCHWIKQNVTGDSAKSKRPSKLLQPGPSKKPCLNS